jgi:predicted membrane-bound mannosyltransferase
MLFISLFTIIEAIVYSAIPYKTPWLMLTFWHGIIFLAAFGFINSYRTILNATGRFLFVTIIVLFFMHTATQIIWTSFLYSNNPGNPYTYSQPQQDLINAVETINEISGAIDKGKEVYISVTAPRHEYWPLPWYLRKYSNVGWSDTVRSDIYRFPIILVTPEYEKDLVKYLYEELPPGQINLYIPMFPNKVELRPNLELRGYIRKDLYDAYYYKTHPIQN